MKRRIFLRDTLIAGGAVMAPLFFNGCHQFQSAESIDQPLVLKSICPDSELILIGKDYRSKFPKENTEAGLLEALFPGRNYSKVKAADKPSNAASLIKLVEKDFQRNNLLIVSGWVVSVTEARQCALLSLK